MTKNKRGKEWHGTEGERQSIRERLGGRDRREGSTRTQSNREKESEKHTR